MHNMVFVDIFVQYCLKNISYEKLQAIINITNYKQYQLQLI